jgi:myo-inositol-1(or 4)-monophosphatase
MENNEAREILAFTERLAGKAGEIQLKAQTEGFGKESKTSQVDLVTDVDKRCEELIVSSLEREFPGFGILGEEGTDQSGLPDSPYRWIIDPLDGTTNYVHNFPFYSVSIALFEHDEPSIGVVHWTPFQRTYTAIADHGSYLNGRRLRASNTASLSGALVATGVPYDRASSVENNVDYIGHIIPRVQGLRRAGSVALDTSFVGEGVFDGYWELKIKLWDFAAGALIASEAGAKYAYRHIGGANYNIVCANQALFPALMEALGEVGDSFSMD